MIRTKGEAGTGDVVNAVTHMRAVFGAIRRLQSLRPEELYTEAKNLQALHDLVRWVAENGRLPVVSSPPAGSRRPADAALCMYGRRRVFVGSGSSAAIPTSAPARSSRRPRTTWTPTFLPVSPPARRWSASSTARFDPSEPSNAAAVAGTAGFPMSRAARWPPALVKRLFVTGGRHLGERLLGPRRPLAGRCLRDPARTRPMVKLTGCGSTFATRTPFARRSRVMTRSSTPAHRQVEDAWSINAEGSAVVAAAARDARLVHLSSDIVFDGTRGRYREDDPVSPVHAYGRSKAEAERLVADVIQRRLCEPRSSTAALRRGRRCLPGSRGQAVLRRRDTPSLRVDDLGARATRGDRARLWHSHAV